MEKWWSTPGDRTAAKELRRLVAKLIPPVMAAATEKGRAKAAACVTVNVRIMNNIYQKSINLAFIR